MSLTAAAEPAAGAAAKPSGGVFGSKFGHINAASILAGGRPSGFGGGVGSAATAGAGEEPPQQEGGITRPGSGPGLGSAPFGFAAYKLNPFAAAAATAGEGGGGGGFASSPSKRKPPSELVKDDGGAGEGGGGGEEEGGEREEDVEAEPVNATYLVPKGAPSDLVWLLGGGLEVSTWDADLICPSPPTKLSTVVLGLKDASYKPVTGEEEETCALQVRSRPSGETYLLGLSPAISRDSVSYMN